MTLSVVVTGMESPRDEGVFGRANIAPGFSSVLYTCPDGVDSAVATVSICNTSAAPLRCRLALAEADTPTAAEYLEYDAEILPAGVVERSGIMLSEGFRLVVEAVEA